MSAKRAAVQTKKSGKPAKPAKEEEASDVESEGEAKATGKEKIPGLHYTANVIGKAYDDGRFYAVNRYAKNTNRRVGRNMIEKLTKSYFDTQALSEALATSKARSLEDFAGISDVADDLIKYAEDHGLTIQQLKGKDSKAFKEYVAVRHYVYLEAFYNEKGDATVTWNMCGPYQDVVEVITTSSGDSQEEVADSVSQFGYTFGNVCGKLVKGSEREITDVAFAANEFFSRMLGVKTMSEEDLKYWRENAVDLIDRYDANASSSEATKSKESAKNYDIEDIVKFAYLLRFSKEEGDEAKAKKSPKGRINNKTPLLTKLETIGTKEGKALKIQNFAEKKTHVAQSLPQNINNSSFVLVANGRIMVKQRVDLEAFIEQIKKEQPDWDASIGEDWLREFDRAMKVKNTPKIGAAKVSSPGKGVATKPKAGAAKVVAPAKRQTAAKVVAPAKRQAKVPVQTVSSEAEAEEEEEEQEVEEVPAPKSPTKSKVSKFSSAAGGASQERKTQSSKRSSTAYEEE